MNERKQLAELVARVEAQLTLEGFVAWLEKMRDEPAAARPVFQSAHDCECPLSQWATSIARKEFLPRIVEVFVYGTESETAAADINGIDVGSLPLGLPPWARLFVTYFDAAHSPSEELPIEKVLAFTVAHRPVLEVAQ